MVWSSKFLKVSIKISAMMINCLARIVLLWFSTCDLLQYPMFAKRASWKLSRSAVDASDPEAHVFGQSRWWDLHVPCDCDLCRWWPGRPLGLSPPHCQDRRCRRRRVRITTKGKGNWPWLLHSQTTASLDKFKLKVLILTCLCPFPFDKADHMRARLHVNACENGMYSFHSLCLPAYLKNLAKSCWWAKNFSWLQSFTRPTRHHFSGQWNPHYLWRSGSGVHSRAKQQHFETG